MKLIKYFSVLLVLLFSSLVWAGSVSLKWDPNDPVDLAGYKMYYKVGSSGEPYDGVGAIEGNSPIDVGNVITFTLNGLTDGDTYYFVVTAYNVEQDESGYSNEVNTLIVIDLYPPTVTGTTPTNDTTPTWSWSSGGGGNGTYRYKLDDSDLTSGATQTTNTTYTPVVALSEGSHTLYVQERDVDENWSNSGSFTIVVDISPPDAPSNLTVVTLLPNLFIWEGSDEVPADQDGTTVSNYTYIFNEAITVSGYITEVYIYVADESGGVLDFAVFRNMSGNSYSDDYVVSGLDIMNGLNVFNFDDELPVEVGECIGFYVTSDGVVDRWQSNGPGPGYMYDLGDQIGANSSTTFTISPNVEYELQVRVKIRS